MVEIDNDPRKDMEVPDGWESAGGISVENDEYIARFTTTEPSEKVDVEIAPYFSDTSDPESVYYQVEMHRYATYDHQHGEWVDSTQVKSKGASGESRKEEIENAVDIAVEMMKGADFSTDGTAKYYNLVKQLKNRKNISKGSEISFHVDTVEVVVEVGDEIEVTGVESGVEKSYEWVGGNLHSEEVVQAALDYLYEVGEHDEHVVIL